MKIPGLTHKYGNLHVPKADSINIFVDENLRRKKGKNSTRVVLIDFLYKHISNYTSDHLLCLHEVNEYTKGIKFRVYFNLKSNCLDSCLDVS